MTAAPGETDIQTVDLVKYTSKFSLEKPCARRVRGGGAREGDVTQVATRVYPPLGTQEQGPTLVSPLS